MKYLAICCALNLPGLLHAQSCAPSTDEDVDVLEDAKTAFLRTDYRAFAALTESFVPDMDERFDALFGPLEVFEPRGFDRCQTILQRRENPSFAQDIVFYFPRGQDTPIALHLLAAEVDGEMTVLEFSYNSSIAGVLDKLR